MAGYGGMAGRMLTDYGPTAASALGGIAYGAGRAELKRQARRLINQGKRMLGLNGKVTKFQRMKGRRLPLFRKGYQRLVGVYGKFKPAFGKELKFFDTVISTSDVNHLWKPIHSSTVVLNNVGRGTDPNQRIGRNFTTRTLQYKFRIEKLDLIEAITYRLVIVLDKQANGQIPLAGDIWLNPGPTASAWSSPRNLENIERFEFLWDKTYTINATSGGSTGRPAAFDDSYYKKISIKTEMSGLSGPSTITDIKDMSITMWACTNLSLNATQTNGTFRIRFTG